jgi:hypothetical protein
VIDKPYHLKTKEEKIALWRESIETYAMMTRYQPWNETWKKRLDHAHRRLGKLLKRTK